MRAETLYGVARNSADLLRMSLVMAAAMLAICLLALVETTNTAQAGSSVIEGGSLSPQPSRSPWSKAALWPPLSSAVPTVSGDGWPSARSFSLGQSAVVEQCGQRPTDDRSKDVEPYAT